MAKKDKNRYNELVKEYKKLAKKADSRLRALETYQHQKNFRTATKYAYARAQKDIKQWGGNKRFDTKPPMTIAGVQAKINDIKTFLEAPSSTKRGIISIYKKRADTLNKKYGTNFTWKEMGNFFESGTFEKMSNMVGSKTSMKFIAQVQNSDEEVKKAIEKSADVNIKVDDWKILDKVNELLEDNSINWKDLL